MLSPLVNALLVVTLAVVLLSASIILIQLHLLGAPPLPSNRRIRAAIMTLLGDSRGGCHSQSRHAAGHSLGLCHSQSPGIPGNSRGVSRSPSQTIPSIPENSAVPPRLPPRRIYECGSGWGGLSMRIAREHADLPVVGVERSLVPYLFARLMLVLRRQPNLRFRLLDLEELSFEEPAVVITYLSSRHMESLSTKLSAGHDITLISAAFALPGRQPDREIRVRDFYRTPVYRYEL